MSRLTFLGTLLHVGNVLILLRERRRYICVVLVLTMLEGRKLRPCLYDNIFILLSHLIDSLDRSRFKLIFLSSSVLLMRNLIPVSFLFLCRQPRSLFEAFIVPWCVCFLHSSCWILVCPFDLKICFELLKILLCYFLMIFSPLFFYSFFLEFP